MSSKGPERLTSRGDDFSKWYQDLVIQSKLADYSPVKGCMVIRPNGYHIWEQIQHEFNRRIKEIGVENAYFPALIPESFMRKEAEHVEGFAPECAVVTHGGGKKLEEPLVVRPTSETIINSMFSKWIQSYRDLPLLMNQWANVVRWEMRTRLFLRTTEFLWQEGHTCHATLEDAEAFTLKMLDEYKNFSEDFLGMPVHAGLKSDGERFAGAYKTYCIEAMMQDTKALQAGTSHNLSSNFAKAFDTQFLDKDGKQKHVFQTSWGVSTRLIGGVVMTHSDDKGLVLPPQLSRITVAMVPIFAKDPAINEKIHSTCDSLAESIRAEGKAKDLGYSVQVKVDKDDSKKAGWKFFEYEMLGVPIRIEIGPRDLEKGHAVVTRRDIGKKEFISLDQLPGYVADQLASMKKDLFNKAKQFRDDNTYEVTDYDDFKSKLEEKGGFYIVPWSQDGDSEKRLKEETGATVRASCWMKIIRPDRVRILVY